MKKMTSKELRHAWIDFYQKRGHVDIGQVSLIGDGQTNVLFNVAGMQALMPYLLGKPHPKGKRLCNIQGCVRTVDIESVGDSSHLTFFEMMGSWSLGDYFKEERCQYSYDLLTNVFDLPKDRLAVTVFAGNDLVPKDEESAILREKSGFKKENIYYLGKEHNWWELESGPCGPDSEMFYITDKEPCSKDCNPSCDCGRFIEIGNDVFMQYDKVDNNTYNLLDNKNVDTGWGFERILAFLNEDGDVYKTDLFWDVIKLLEEKSHTKYLEDDHKTYAIRVIADHIRTSVMLLGDINSLVPSNVGAGYILRRLIRRAVRYAKVLNIDTSVFEDIVNIYIDKVYNESYPNLIKNKKFIIDELNKEVNKFNRTLSTGMKEFNKVVGKIKKNSIKEIDGITSFRLYDTFGFPFELTKELAIENGLEVSKDEFDKCFKEHQERSKKDISKAKGGLTSLGEMEIKYHTATHLLNAALKVVVNSNIHQMGSNITSERLRFDFNCDHKLSDEEKDRVEELVNKWIDEDLVVTKKVMSKDDAISSGAECMFIEKYPNIVSVYSIGDVSKELCGGPHVSHTKELGHFKIKKEESSSSGVRRIKGILE